jgi:sugar/nucleoside kinase (ribokinase family)
MKTEHLKLLVAESSNTDIVIRTSHLPRPGETVSGAFRAEKKVILNPASVIRVKAVDTTTALSLGDIFNGAPAVEPAESRPLSEAAAFVVRAAAICVTCAGAQASAPYRYEVDLCH